MTIQEKAAQIRSTFVEQIRTDGTKYWSTESEDAAITELCHAAHDDLMPDDWKYRFIVDALDLISEAEDVDGIAEIEPDIYTADLTAWLASHNGRVEYLTRAIEDYEPKDGFTALSIAQSIEREDVLYSVLSSIRSMI